MKLATIAFTFTVLLIASSAPAVDAGRQLLQASAPGPEDTEFDSIAAAIANSRGFSSFQAALNVSGLLDSLNDTSLAITIFVPTDAAVNDFLVSQNWTLFDLLDSDYLNSVVSYHIVPAVLPVEEMTNGEELPTFFVGQNLTLSSPVSSYSFFTVVAEDSTANIIRANIAAGQSIIHVINTVLIPSVAALEEAAYGQQLGDDNETSETVVPTTSS